MNYLYNESDLLKITNSKKNNLYIALGLIFLFVLSLVVFIVASSYKDRVVFSVLSSIFGVLFVGFTIYFMSKYFYLRRLENEYRTLLNSEEILIECEILECSTFLTTLPDKSRCYEVLIYRSGREMIYYLSEIFADIDLEVGKCRLAVAYDYIKGYQYED